MIPNFGECVDDCKIVRYHHLILSKCCTLGCIEHVPILRSVFDEKDIYCFVLPIRLKKAVKITLCAKLNRPYVIPEIKWELQTRNLDTDKYHSSVTFFFMPLLKRSRSFIKWKWIMATFEGHKK